MARRAMLWTSATLAMSCVFWAGRSTAAGGNPTLRVSPASGLLDAPLHLDATGVPAAARVGVEVSVRDFEGRLWRARGSKRADGDGALRIDGAGLLPTLRPVDPQHFQPTVGLFPPAGGLRLRIDLLVEGRRVASATATRLTEARGVTRRMLELKEEGLVGRYSALPGRAPRPAVLMLGGSEGGLRDGLAARLLAAHGYPILELAYFGVAGLPAALKRIRLEYLEAGLRWLARQRGVRPDRLVVLGASRGAELALLLGTRFPSLIHGVVAYAPSAVVYPSPDCVSPAWTQANRPVPFVPCSQLGEARPRTDLIPVEKIRGPILLVAGDDDLVWPAGGYARAIADRLRARGKRDFSSLVYSGAGHAIVAGFPYLPLPTLSGVGGSAAGGDPLSDARARTHSWSQLLRLLERSR